MLKFYTSLTTNGLFKTTLLTAWLLLIQSFYSDAQTGVLDVNFGNKGKVITAVEINAAANTTAPIALQKDGKIITLVNRYSTVSLLKYNTDGSQDSAFPANSIAIDTAEYFSNLSLALQEDGKILVSGTPQTGNSRSFRLTRFNADGTRDSSFGINGTAMAMPDVDNQATIHKILVRPGGKILVAGIIGINTAQAGLIQFNTNGIVDSSFGENGKVFNPADPGNLVKFNHLALKMSKNDQIVLACSGRIDPFPSSVTVFRFNGDGSYDNTFGIGGMAARNAFGSELPDGVEIDIQADNKIVILLDGNEGNIISFGFVIRLNPNGTIDNTFADNGILNIYISEFGIDIETCSNLILQPNGKILISGGARTTNNNDFFLVRLNANGQYDSTFGKRGIILTEFLNGYGNISTASALQPDGKIILAGYTRDSIRQVLAFARYEANPILYYNTLKGSAYLDQNKNNFKDPGEDYVTDSKISTIKTDVDTVGIYAVNGQFTLDVDTGSYVTAIAPNLPYYTAAPQSFTTTHATYFNTDSISFALQPIAGKRDLAVSIIPVAISRPGFNTTYKVLYTNQGTDTVATGTIQFVKNSKLAYKSAFPAPTMVKGDTLQWSFANLKPTDTAGIDVHFTIAAPPAVNFGDTLHSVATIIAAGADLTPIDNTADLLDMVRGSYDPNDKTESHGGKLKVAQVQKGDYLQYTIRFQNTGNDTAFNVHIRDTLSSNVDWSTLKMIGSSHNVQLTVNDSRYCSWAFTNINLVDSNTNEPASHGYITYSIKVKPTLAAGAIINNTAHIYFDYNLPVQTNIETTTVEEVVLPLKLITFSARHQGKTNVAEWHTTNEVNISHFEIEKSTNGTTFNKVGVVQAGSSKYTFTDNTPVKGINYYRLKMVDKDGRFEYSTIKSLDNTSGLYVSLYPNPAIQQLVVQLDSETRSLLQIQVMNLEGKVMFTKSVTMQQGQHLLPVNVSALQKGSYFLKVSANGINQTITKFQKM